MNVYLVYISHFRSRGGWIDKYIVQAKSKKKARKKCRNYYDTPDQVEVVKLDTDNPVLIGEV